MCSVAQRAYVFMSEGPCADRPDRWAASGPAVIAAVSAGGIIGAEARYAAGLWRWQLPG